MDGSTRIIKHQSNSQIHVEHATIHMYVKILVGVKKIQGKKVRKQRGNNIHVKFSIAFMLEAILDGEETILHLLGF